MKEWKIWKISLFVLFCILLNYGGRVLAEYFELPMWLDSFGTVISAYIGGPFLGVIVGVTANFIYGTLNHVSYVYAVTSAAIALIVGIASRKKKLQTLFGTMAVSSQTALVSAVISTFLNLLYYGGRTGNMWGDGVMNMLREWGWPTFLCSFIGEFYLDFFDKIMTFLILYGIFFLIYAVIIKPGKNQKGDFAGEEAALMLFFLLLAGCMAAARPVHAGESGEAIDYNDFVQTIYSSNNGLPCGASNDIAETNDGILWIGTYAGLYRYNGSEFRWMDNFESVRNVNCLYVDPEGRLWIGTNDNGLSICINEKIVNVIDEAGGLPSNSVRCITRSSDGYYYVGTTDSMQILTLNSGIKRAGTLEEVNYGDSISADEKGNVAAVTNDGRLFLLKEGQIISRLQIASGREIFTCCGFDRSGRLMAGTSANHIYIYDVGDGHFEKLDKLTCESLNNLNDLYFLDNGEIFVTSDSGIGYLDTSEYFHSVNVNEFNNSIDNMQIDYQGNLWFCSSRKGLLRMSGSAFKDVYSTVGMDTRVVNTITFWKDQYYFGTDKGLDVVDAACREQYFNELTEELEDARIRCMFVDSEGHLWICTYGQGLIEVDPDGKEYYYNSENGSFGNRARLAAEISDGTIIAGGDTGISFIRDHKILRTIGHSDGLINSMILTVTQMQDGRVLAGTDGDGIAVIENGEVTRMLTREDGLSSEVILRTVKDPEAEAVFIVTSNGLCYMDETEAIRPLNNFPYFNNYDIWIKDGDTMFVMSSAGIYVVSRRELLSGMQDISYDLLDSRKGLNSALTANSWNYSDGKGNLFLASDKGVYVVDTDRYTSDTRSYRMILDNIVLDGVSRKVERGVPIRVGRGISRIELHPEVINYTIQDPYIGYYLDGFEGDWMILPQSSMESIVYTNLPSGEYTFRMAVFDSNRENILEERSYTVIKEKEIYDNQWFKFYMLIGAFLIVAWFTIYIVRSQIQRTFARQQQELERAKEKIEMGNQTIQAVAKAVDAKDERTSKHSQRVSEYAVLIGRELGFDDTECENLRRAALTHDIGKIGIPDSILNKPARLTDDEYGVMKSHTVRGAEILKDFTLIDHVVDGAQFHHERYDGKGYPAGLKGEEIPIYGRIIGVADAFDAMTANRVYRKQMDFDYVLNEMKKGRGTQFDPQMDDILLRLIDEGKIDLEKLYPGFTEASRAAGKPGDEGKNEGKNEVKNEGKNKEKEGDA